MTDLSPEPSPTATLKRREEGAETLIWFDFVSLGRAQLPLEEEEDERTERRKTDQLPCL
ncbi:hypothetical protein OIU74_000749, partial [Salix koriyanagi]